MFLSTGARKGNFPLVFLSQLSAASVKGSEGLVPVVALSGLPDPEALLCSQEETCS